MAKLLPRRLHVLGLPQHVRSSGVTPTFATCAPGPSSFLWHQCQGRSLGFVNSSAAGRTGSCPSSSSSSPFRARSTSVSVKWPRPYSQSSKTTQPPDCQVGVDQSSSKPAQPAAPKQPITKSFEAARAKVRSSLTGLTPHENIYNIPNFLTLTRLVAAPATAYLLLHDQHTLALGLFAYAGITDLIDGWMARKWKLQTVAGSVMDPMADKALMIIVTVTLAVKGAIPLYLATLVLGRDASLALAALYYRYASLPAPKTFLRYWDFSLPSAEVHPTTVSKYNTFLQLILIGSTLALPVVTAGGQGTDILQSFGLSTGQLHNALTYFQWLVAATTAWSGLSYAYLKNAVTILGPNETLKAKQGARGRAIIGLTFGSCVLAAVWLATTVDAPAHRESPRRESSIQDP